MGCTDIGIGKSEFVAKTQFLWSWELGKIIEIFLAWFERIKMVE